MPKICIADIAVDTKTNYPAPFKKIVEGRERQRLGNAGGLTQFGVNLTRLRPGAASSMRHWHQNEDELIYIIDGEVVLIENEGEIVLRPGDVATFKAGVDNGHCLVNRSGRDVIVLEVGTRSAQERVVYPDVDYVLERDGAKASYQPRSGETKS
jgi:uncharacterized cupin superfamily protein